MASDFSKIAKQFNKILEYNPIVMPKIYYSMWQ